ncbi:MAG TPA: hypothetical protein VL172_01240, partial [Kofleriaceae bacterium]|nr:hypothetical protein [Kofleriaceae bacterium]
AFSPDGKLLATGYGTTTAAVIFDVTTGARVRVLGDQTRGSGAADALAFSPDGKLLAVGDSEGRATLWDVAGGKPLRRLTHTDWVHAVAFSPDGKLLATGAGREVTLWDVAAGRALRTLGGHPGTIVGLAFSPAGATMVVAGGTLRTWRGADGALLRDEAAHGGAVDAVAVRTTDGRVASAGRDSIIRLWSGGGQSWDTLGAFADEVTAVRFAPAGDLLVAGGERGMLQLWDLTSDARPRTLVLGDGAGKVTGLSFTPDGRSLMVVDAADFSRRRVTLWDLATRTRRFALGDGHLSADFTGAAALSPDGATIATGDFQTSGRVVVLWDAAANTRRATWRAHGSYYTSMAFASDGRRLAVADAVGLVRLIDPATGAITNLTGGHRHGIHAVTFSPDGTLLCSTGNGDGDVANLWDVATGQVVHALAGHATSLTDAAFRPDGALLATASWDHTIRLWDPATGAARALLTGHTGTVHTLAFDPSGRTLASASSDRTVMLWDPATGKPLATIFVTRDHQWLVIAADGRIDGSPGPAGGQSFLTWQAGSIELPGFTGWDRAQTPGLLASLINRK